LCRVLGGFIGSKIKRNQYWETDQTGGTKSHRGRRLKPEKKEEEFAVNLSKKSHGEEDPFLAARFVSVQFRR
jgi:hypothetical protein